MLKFTLPNTLRTFSMVAILALVGCGWGQPVIHPEGLPAVLWNIAADEVEDLQTEGSRGRVPKMKEPLFEWGPITFRADGRGKIRRYREDRRPIQGIHPCRKKRRSTSLSLRVTSDLIYGEVKFRF